MHKILRKILNVQGRAADNMQNFKNTQLTWEEITYCETAFQIMHNTLIPHLSMWETLVKHAVLKYASNFFSLSKKEIIRPSKWLKRLETKFWKLSKTMRKRSNRYFDFHWNFLIDSSRKALTVKSYSNCSLLSTVMNVLSQHITQLSTCYKQSTPVLNCRASSTFQSNPDS